jgi:hypothetical protein
MSCVALEENIRGKRGKRIILFPLLIIFSSFSVLSLPYFLLSFLNFLSSPLSIHFFHFLVLFFHRFVFSMLIFFFRSFPLPRIILFPPF